MLDTLKNPLGWPRNVKKFLIFNLDFLLIPITLIFAFMLRLGELSSIVFDIISPLLVLIVMSVGAVIVLASRLYRSKLYSFDAHSFGRIGAVALGLTLTAVATSYFLDLWAPRSVPLIFGANFFIAAIVSRYLIVFVLDRTKAPSEKRVPVAIYGAGAGGIQLLTALRQSSEVKPVVFIDDSPAIQKLLVSGVKVKSPAKLPRMIQEGRVQRVLLAIPSLSSERRTELLGQLSKLGCEVQVMPSYVELISGGGSLETLRPVSPDQLLGRDKVDLNIPEISKAYAGRKVMVTGAGGSIGSELCKQLIECQPAEIIFFERNEFALYEVDRMLHSLAISANIATHAVLGCVTDRGQVRHTIERFGVDTIIHAAAYKHVPLVEMNELQAAYNNVIGTQTVAEEAERSGVERFILVSSDKAVRPTSVMGATKRMSELVIQDVETRTKNTKYSMVRFGNVLGSSGSVIPLFKRQIRAGGPVTVTHQDVTRYFMTIPEAARLVLLAGAYSQGGDLFVLDMGEPVKIVDLARRMIEQSGRRVSENGEEGIEIKITGLRPGEKLFEELLIDDESMASTPHEKILRAEETHLSQLEVAAMIKTITKAVDDMDNTVIRSVISRFVKEYQPEKTAAAN